MSHFLFEMWLNVTTRKQHQTEGNKMTAYTEQQMNIFHNYTIHNEEDRQAFLKALGNKEINGITILRAIEASGVWK